MPEMAKAKVPMKSRIWENVNENIGGEASMTQFSGLAITPLMKIIGEDGCSVVVRFVLAVKTPLKAVAVS